MKVFLICFFLFSFKANALVDYSETVAVPKDSKTTNSSFQKMSASNSGASSSGRNLAWKSDLSLTGHYESLEISGQKYGLLTLDTHIETNANVFFNASYWHAQSGRENSSGNPKLMVGFNWLRVGSSSDEARFDLFGGLKFATQSKLGSSRSDSIIGIETTKRFGTFGLGVGFDLTMTGDAKNGDERSIGNINHIVLSGAWMVSPDIQFELELDHYTINESRDLNKDNSLREKQTFSTFSPKLNLGLAPAVNLEMGARFRIKKANETANLMSAGVFDLNGANTNSLFAGLNLSI